MEKPKRSLEKENLPQTGKDLLELPKQSKTVPID